MKKSESAGSRGIVDDGVRDSGDGSVAVVLDSAVLMAASPV